MAYDEIRKYHKDIVVSAHDAFIDYKNWYYLGEEPYKRFMLDTHIYQIFSPAQQNWTCEQHYAHPCDYRQKLNESNSKVWTVVGEFALVTPMHCPNTTLFASQQLSAFELASGWMFWSHFRQHYGDWSLEDSVNGGYLKPNGPNKAIC